MNRDEQKQITEVIERAVKGSACAGPPPLDIEADAIIRALFVRNPEAAYRLTMLAVTQAQQIATYQHEICVLHMQRGFFARLFNRAMPRPEMTEPAV